MNETKMIFNVPEFTGENVPVSVAAKVMKKDQQFIRQGMIQGILPMNWSTKLTNFFKKLSKLQKPLINDVTLNGNTFP